MSQEKIIKYIKSQFKYYEQHICNSLNKSTKNKYTLKNPILRENCIIDSPKEIDRQLSAENDESINHLEESIL